MDTKKTFTLTKDHIKLLRHAFVQWQDCETGAPEIDPKRPYGNSYVPEDVSEIIGYEVDWDKGATEEQENYLIKLHRETETALQIILFTGKFKPGKYRMIGEYGDEGWEVYS